MSQEVPAKLVKSAIRTMELFRVFSEAKRPLSLADVAAAMKAPKSSCYELIQTLAWLGYVLVIDDGRSYYPSRRLFEMAEQINAFNPIKQKINEKLRALRDQTGETVFVGRLQGTSVVFSEVFDGTHTIRYMARAGDLKSLHASALGKALLGALDEEVRNRLIGELTLTRFSEHTLTRKKDLKADIARLCEQGVFVSRGENLPDVMGIACPVKVQGHQLAIGLAGPIPRMERHLASYTAALRQVIDELG